jgi:antagonist of KipI
MDTFLVLTPGPFTTVQDRGRFGYQNMGMPLSGAVDSYAHRIANLLVNNPEDSAVLEITILGPQLAVMKEADVALTGAEMEMKLNFKPVESWRSIRVEPGDILSIQAVKSGCRGYLSVTGGIAVPVVMGSRSTYVGGKLGGYQGRPLKKGDIVKSDSGTLLDSPRRLRESWIPRHSGNARVRAIPGPQDDFFDKGLSTLFEFEFMVTARADRMGYRLQGPPIEHRKEVSKSIISEPTMPGGIQVPADKQPIILLTEQTVGGYTKIASVISTDLPKVAQTTPGDTISFERISLEDAHRIYLDHERQIEKISRELAGTQ